MPNLKTYDLFISHAWNYNHEYYTLVNMLKNTPYFYFRNYSVPEHDRLKVNTNKALDEGLWRQIRPVNAVLILSGMYFNHRKWIQREIEIAQFLHKPIIGIVPRGQLLTPAEIQRTSKTMVGWYTPSIIEAIRRYSI